MMVIITSISHHQAGRWRAGGRYLNTLPRKRRNTCTGDDGGGYDNDEN